MSSIQKRIVQIEEEKSRLDRDFFSTQIDNLVCLIFETIKVIKQGGKIIFFGNGGSAADAQHLAAEFVNRFLLDRKALPALALTTDTSILTSIANDQDFSEIFARQIEAIARSEDLALGLTTSGSSANVLKGLQTAKKKGLLTAAFTGSRGLATEADIVITVNSLNTPRIQELHILAGHILCEQVELELFGNK